MEFHSVSDQGVVVNPTPDEAPGIVHAIREVCRARGLRIYAPMLEEEDGKLFVDLRFLDEHDLVTIKGFCESLKSYSIVPPQFMVTVTQGSRIKLKTMRFFTGARAEFEARAYVASIPREDGTAVMYEVRHNAPPVKVKGVLQGRATRGT